MNGLPDNGFVKMSAWFMVEGMWAKEMAPLAIASQTLWQLHAACFFFNTKLGILQFKTTLSLSPNISPGPSGLTPIILNVFWCSKINSTVTLADTNSEPWVDVSTVFCLCDVHFTGVSFKNRRTPVTNCLVTRSCASSASLCAVILIFFPKGLGSMLLCRMSSSASGQNSCHCSHFMMSNCWWSGHLGLMMMCPLLNFFK